MNGNRNDNPHIDAEFDDEDGTRLREFADAVEACLGRRETIERVLSDVRERDLRGERVQPVLDGVLDTEECLLTVALVEINEDGLGGRLAAATERGLLTAADREAFEAFWNRVGWIVPAAEAHVRGHELGYRDWTDKSLSCERRGDRVVVSHRLEWGLDEVHDIEAPLARYWSDLLGQLAFVVERIDDVDPDDGEVGALVDSKALLDSIRAKLDDLDPECGDGSPADTPASLLERIEDGPTDCDGTEGDDGEDDEDSSLIGFA